MKIFNYQKNILVSLFVSSVFAMCLLGCSEDKEPKQEQPTAPQITKEQNISVDSPHDTSPEANDQQKQKFEHEFAAQCADRELNNSSNKTSDAERINKSCGCIASYIMKDLTDEEAEKFLSEHEDPQSIRIKFEAAAYECLQEKAQPAGPKLFGKPQ